ncbi:MAG: DNA-processing protein DprA [Candidatus Anstonellales archaeon]
MTLEIKTITINDPNYPNNLRKIENPPKVLYYSGDISLANRGRMIAIVGTRNPNKIAIEFAYNIAYELAKRKYIIVSGGARGVDTAAHEGCLSAEGKTIAVLGSGFNHLYPEENAELFKKIASQGLILSEHHPEFFGTKFSYTSRNRITSGLADAVLLVASKIKGGSMNQISVAYKQGKMLLCAKKEGIYPNEGLMLARERYGAEFVEDVDDILALLKRVNKIKLSSFICEKSF